MDEIRGLVYDNMNNPPPHTAERKSRMIDYNDLISRIWKITWKHKILWLAGFVMMMCVFAIFPLVFAPMILLLSAERSAQLEDYNRLFALAGNPFIWIVLGLGFVFFIVISYSVSSITRPMLILGTLKAERGAQSLSFGELLRESTAFFWRILGLMFLFFIAIMLIQSIISGVQVIGAILTLGLASMCLWPLTFLMYPLMYAAMVLMELAEAAIVVDGLGIMDALRKAWDLVRNNKMPVFIVTMILYFGLGMLSSVVMVPFFIPFGFMPMLMLEGNLPSEVLWIAGICFTAFYPIVAVVQGIVLTMMKAGWAITYLRLSPASNNAPVFSEANA